MSFFFWRGRRLSVEISFHNLLPQKSPRCHSNSVCCVVSVFHHSMHHPYCLPAEVALHRQECSATAAGLLQKTACTCMKHRGIRCTFSSEDMEYIHLRQRDIDVAFVKHHMCMETDLCCFKVKVSPVNFCDRFFIPKTGLRPKSLQHGHWVGS